MAADSNRSRPQPAAIWESQAQPAPFYRWSELLKSQTRRPQSQNWGRQAAANRRIAGHKATKVASAVYIQAKNPSKTGSGDAKTETNETSIDDL